MADNTTVEAAAVAAVVAATPAAVTTTTTTVVETPVTKPVVQAPRKYRVRLTGLALQQAIAGGKYIEVIEVS